MGPQRPVRKYSIRFTVGSMFVLATLLTTLFAISVQYYFSRQMSEELVLSKLSMTSSKVSEHIQKIDSSASNVARLLKNISLVTEYQFSESEVTTIFTQALKDNPMFYSIYWGNDKDDFFQIINLESSPIVREKIRAQENDRWVIIKISGSKENRIRKTYYYTSNFIETSVVVENSNYYPTQRPWYGEASKESVFKTEPYLFQHLKITGQTYAVKTHLAVIGIDIVLSSVSSLISPESLGLSSSSGVESFLFNQKGEVIASSRLAQETVQIPPSKPLKLDRKNQGILDKTRSLLVSNQNDWGPLDYSSAGEPKGYAIDMLTIVSEMTGLEFEYVNGFNWQELTEKFERGELDILQSTQVQAVKEHARSAPLYTLPLGIATGEGLVDELPALNSKPVAVVKGREIDKVFEDDHSLSFLYATTIEEAMEWLSENRVKAVVDALPVLESYKTRLHNGGLSVNAIEPRRLINYHLEMKYSDQQVTNLINLAVANITEEQWLTLNEKWLNKRTMQDTMVPYSEVIALVQQPIEQNQMMRVDINGENRYLFLTPMGSSASATEFFAVVVPEHVIFAKVIPKVIITIGISLLVLLGLLPLAWVFGNPIVKPVGLLTKETNKVSMRKFDEVHHVQSRIKEVSELSDSMVEMVDEIKSHQKSQEELVEAFIKLIAQAIDEKSPYTAGHCNRVPEIGMLLAKAAEDADSGKFKDFKFENDKERREFQIAAWLHDCGKITTPEHIVDKGTKLEANYNRIHEIRTRFEVLWRDAEIVYLKQVHIDGIDSAAAQLELDTKFKQLQDDFSFIAESNVGSEFMCDENIERVKKIASQTWQRNFNHKLGLSPFEELESAKFVCSARGTSLPVTERLLADKPEHVIQRIRPMDFDPKLKIKVDVPTNLYNLGEVYNLSIRSGTLTTEDRFKINEHMISGIKMLNNIPFPPELSRVPRYASTHHETLKGTGYPRKLKKEQLSIPERILTIADIFEALTAADRPYKKAKPVSVAIHIMYKMASDEHLDMDLFILFLESGVYKEYAEKFLPTNQIDEVDIAKYTSRDKQEKKIAPKPIPSPV
ncbi:HD domain-containing phosphohydrolase [uncultured Vibrio sp.]|uniref:HD domain-containing phosphohydrolase n=1 Tax=uncultured Vibrio sp. TaxID=114054 RepID=UPI00090EF301|nr:HD domain-containing phosphohydrolase [uncultured Vibrio sp.]OIQ26230.1 MAG: phosphohydrolase [Vibrio sp. MedPE-SWchi]